MINVIQEKAKAFPKLPIQFLWEYLEYIDLEFKARTFKYDTIIYVVTVS